MWTKRNILTKANKRSLIRTHLGCTIPKFFKTDSVWNRGTNSQLMIRDPPCFKSANPLNSSQKSAICVTLGREIVSLTISFRRLKLWNITVTLHYTMYLLLSVLQLKCVHGPLFLQIENTHDLEWEEHFIRTLVYYRYMQ